MISGHSLHEFVREIVAAYLEDDVAEIRRAATLTCCRVMVKDPILAQNNTAAMLVVGDILERLLAVGIADTGIAPSSIHSDLW
jgi:FKBP12-rapamycin complex-associated protein